MTRVDEGNGPSSSLITSHRHNSNYRLDWIASTELLKLANLFENWCEESILWELHADKIWRRSIRRIHGELSWRHFGPWLCCGGSDGNYMSMFSRLFNVMFLDLWYKFLRFIFSFHGLTGFRSYDLEQGVPPRRLIRLIPNLSGVRIFLASNVLPERDMNFHCWISVRVRSSRQLWGDVTRGSIDGLLT